MKRYVAYIFVVLSVTVVLFAGIAAVPSRASAQDMAGMDMGGTSKFVWHWGAHAVGMVSRVSPAVTDSTIVEAYITQPTLMGGVETRNGHFALQSTISLEGLTLDRGELGPGTYGEGYVDRRHPHTYLHELVATARTSLPYDIGATLSAGRGFAPFGTDDPMMRPFVRFPVNHHLSQVLERLIVIGGVRRGPLALEVGTFSGNEPLSPRDLGDPKRFADSWSARATVRPVASWELQVSRAFVNSPEEPTGEGHDQRKISVSARHDGVSGKNRLYSLVEWSRSTIIVPRGDAYATSSLLAEGSLARSDWSAALRLERSTRPEELRTESFRAPWPPYEDLILGFTRWSVVSLRAQREMHVSRFGLSPFVETSLAHVAALHREQLFQPREFYGSNNLWSLSAGVRMSIGMQHDRMGRYGVAVPQMSMSHEMSHDMSH